MRGVLPPEQTMKHTAIPTVLALAGLAVGLVPSATGELAGPGAVYYAASNLCVALDRGDVEYLAKAFVDSRHGLEFFLDKSGELDERAPVGAFEFVDVRADGTALCATSLPELQKAAAGLADAELGAPTTALTRVYADCPSGECSYAVLEFERAFGAGDARRVVPMRATMLVRYDSDHDPHFRVFHWHAARR